MLAYTVPIAFLFGVMVTIGRMAADAEILALRACGFGLREIVLPMFALAVAISALTAWLLLDVEHRARRELRAAVIAMTTQGSMIEPGEFKRVGERIVYVRSRDGEGRLESILISDRTDPERPFMIFAESGMLRLGRRARRGALPPAQRRHPPRARGRGPRRSTSASASRTSCIRSPSRTCSSSRPRSCGRRT